MLFTSRSTTFATALATSWLALAAGTALLDSLRVRAEASPAQQQLVPPLADSLLREAGAMSDPDQIAAAFERAQAYRARGFPGANGTREVTPVSLGDVKGGLDDGELWLGWLCGSDRSLLFAVTRDQHRVFSISGVAALSEKIRSARKTLETSPHGGHDTKSATTAAEELARLVFGDALPLVSKARALILVPDGPVELVPFSALVVKGQPLVATRTTAVSLSVSFLNDSPDESGPSRPLLAVQGGAGEPRLSSSERELQWLAGTFQGVTVWSADRSVPDSAALAGYEALHFAGRVTYDDQDPWQSGVDAGRRHAPRAATDPPSPGADGLLRAERIAALRVNADLVVLTTCAHSSSVHGAGPLPTSFLAAGVRAVIVPLWPLDDRDVESIVRELYRSLDAGKSAAEALRAAQDHQRRTSGTQHPYHWAGFALWGDGTVKLDLKPNPIWKRGTPGKH